MLHADHLMQGLLKQVYPFMKAYIAKLLWCLCRFVWYQLFISRLVKRALGLTLINLIVESGGCYSTFSGDNGLPWTDIDYNQLTSMIKSGNIQLFDVREPEEVEETGMMPSAVNVPCK